MSHILTEKSVLARHTGQGDISEAYTSMIDGNDTTIQEAAQDKWLVTFKTTHASVEVSARNTAEAIKKASVIAKKAGKDPKSKSKMPVGDPMYDKVDKVGK